MSREGLALDSATLRKRVVRFVDRELAVLPPFAALADLSRSFGPIVIFGGLIRDLALGHSREFSSDVDLVLKGMPASVLNRFLAPHGAQRNAFGGFRVQFGRWGFDLWTFDSTWAFASGLVGGRELVDLLQTTFFNWDAVFFELETSELVGHASYFEDLKNLRLAINLRQTPNELGAAVRALRAMSEGDVSLDPDLSAFLHAQIAEHGIHRIVEMDAKRSGRRRLTMSFVGSVAIALQAHLATRPAEPFLFFDFQHRLPLEAAGTR